MLAPLVGTESSPARNAITLAISAGVTQRLWSASGCSRRFSGVSITLGSTVFARTPCFLYSTATALVNASTAAFAVTYPAAPANGATAARDDMQTTEPPPAATRWGRAAAVIRYVGRRFSRRIA